MNLWMLIFIWRVHCLYPQNFLEYRNCTEQRVLFPTPYEIVVVLGINKSLTHHTARKTFASTVLLYNDVPIEIVSQLLGHSSIAITEASYGKVVKKRVSDEVMRLNGSRCLYIHCLLFANKGGGSPLKGF